MLEQVKLITSRRAYEFGVDELRLSTLSIQLIQQQIQQLFNFQTTIVGSPMPTFGDVPGTFPPGVVFDLGVWIHQEEQIVPIRFIHFEQNRIVIDVAGPTAAIDGIADRLFQFLSGLRAADESPVAEKPKRVLDYSEITAQFPYPLDAVFAKPLRKLLSKTMHTDTETKDMVIVPTIAMQAFPAKEVLQAVPGANTTNAFTFTQRSGTSPEEHIYFSAAPLSSEAHLKFLNELEATFRPQ